MLQLYISNVPLRDPDLRTVTKVLFDFLNSWGVAPFFVHRIVRKLQNDEQTFAALVASAASYRCLSLFQIKDHIGQMLVFTSKRKKSTDNKISVSLDSFF